MRQVFGVGLLILIGTGAALAQQQPYQPTPAERRTIQAKMEELAARLTALRKGSADQRLLADVEIHHKAAEWILRYPEEFYRPEYVKHTLDSLDIGLERATELARGKHSWTTRKGRLARGYRSQVDGSVQPYALRIPDSYDGSKPMRLDVILPGRNSRLTEAWFIATHTSGEPLPESQNYLQLEVFGRLNNAYRWAGETDVWEAIAAVERDYNIDPDRIVVRGFSMGGAGAFHMGLHHPSRWAAVEAGAGFTDTIRYAGLPNLPEYRRQALRIYDADDYALNAFNVPLVGYGGDDDPQILAADNVRQQLMREGFRFEPDGLNWTTEDLRAVFLVAPRTPHRFHPDSKVESDAFIDPIVKKGRIVPDHIRFVTYTLRYANSFWVEVEGLGKHYERAEIDARRSKEGSLVKSVTVKTRNVTMFALRDIAAATKVEVDGQLVPFPPGPAAKPERLLFAKNGERWEVVSAFDGPGRRGLRKKPGLQGPIDDAFREAFLGVRPTGQVAQPVVHTYAIETADRFEREYARWLRGDPRFKNDADVSEQDIRSNHLILFGDPESNLILKRILDQLPIQWTREVIRVGGKTYDAKQHVVAFIYPNPLSPERYVVVNSGHTFHQAEFAGTNALLFPRLGDYAVLRLQDGQEPEVVEAGFFDENWRFPASP